MELEERAARAALVDELVEAGILGPRGAEAARRWIGARLDWRGWLDRMLLGLGATLVATGVVCFFAYNWASIPAMAKFALLESALLASALATWRVGLNCLTGKVMLTGSSVLVGVLLAVYGQVYPTGADAWQLFAGWAALIAGWAVVGRFVPLWMLVFGLIDLALVQGASGFTGSALCNVLGLVNGGFVVAAEVGRESGAEWLEGRWYRNVLWVACIGILTVPAISTFGSRHAEPEAALGAALWGMALVLGHGHYLHRAPELTALALGGASAGVVALAFAFRVMASGFLGFDLGVLFLGALTAVGIATALGAWLKSAAAQMEAADV